MATRGKMGKSKADLVPKIQRLLKTESLMGAVLLLKSLDPTIASKVLETLPPEDRKKLHDLWLGSEEELLTELPVEEEPQPEVLYERLEDSVPFFPDHFVSEVTAILWIICLISVLTIFAPVGLEMKANPFNTPVGVRPEWYFLFLYSLLLFVPPIISILVPLVGGLLLTLLPFLDKNPGVKLSKRKIALSACMILLTIIITLSVIGAFGE